LLLALGLGCRPDATPRGWPSDASSRALPVVLELEDAEEARRWEPGPAVRTRLVEGSGLAIEPLSGATRGLHVSRALPLSADRLGAVEIWTKEPMPPLVVSPYIRGRTEPGDAVRAVPAPADPRRQIARFRVGRWNRRAVQGLRVTAPGGPDPWILERVRVSTDRYVPVATPDPEVDWTSAFAGTAPRHAILIVADALRADHMSLYGYGRPTTPRLDALARHGVVFEGAWSQAACTFPSVNSLLTSQPTSSFLGEPPGIRRSLAGRGSLAERLRAAGWRTWAVSASWIVRATSSPVNDWGGGYAAGFDVFDESCANEPAGCVNEIAVDLLDSIEGTDERFFLYLHYLDPHDPYRPPPNHERVFARPFDGRAATARGEPNPLARILYRGEGVDAVPTAEVRQLVDLYDEEIRYLDREIERLFEVLRQRGWLSETVIVLASDHGESFLDHGHLQHCRTVFEDQVRTPLVVWAPGSGRAGRRAGPARNLDIVPTILDGLGVAVAGVPPAGRSLWPVVEGAALAEGIATSAQGPWESATDGRFKWIENVREEGGSLFDLERDPAEQHDVAATHPELRERLDRALDEERSRAASEAASEAARREAVDRQLEALGYLQ
jgi:arylsulfatase